MLCTVLLLSSDPCDMMTKCADEQQMKEVEHSEVQTVSKYTGCMFVSACFPCDTIALCDSAVSLCYHSEERSPEEVTRASIDNSLIRADVTKGVLTAAAVLDETQRSENCQRVKYETRSKSHTCVLITSLFECVNAQSVFTPTPKLKCCLHIILETGPQDERETSYNGVSLLAKVSLCRLATVSSSQLQHSILIRHLRCVFGLRTITRHLYFHSRLFTVLR